MVEERSSEIKKKEEKIEKYKLKIEEMETNFKNDLANEISAFDDEKRELNQMIEEISLAKEESIKSYEDKLQTV